MSVLPANLGLLREAALVALAQTEPIIWDDDPDGLAEALLVWDDIVVAAAAARRHLAGRMAIAIGGERAYALDGIATFERRVDRKETWDDPLVAGQILDALTTLDRDSGEVVYPHPVALLDALLKTAKVGYWRIGALEELLGSMDEARKHRTVENRHPTVSIRRFHRDI